MFKRVLIVFCLGLLAGCSSYKQNIMFKTGDSFSAEPVMANALVAERNYLIQKNDFLILEIFSNDGEKLIDPNPELSQSQQSASASTETKNLYLVDLNGVAKFPMAGEIKVEGLSLRQAEQVLQKEYEKYFKSPFVTLKFNNKRVIVLGSPGGQVLPLANENMTLVEVIALAKGINIDGKAQNIRLLRGNKTFQIDFSTIEGFQKGNMIVENGDIVYVEPVRKPVAEGFRDYSILITFLVSITTLVTLITR
jgi:polysaccharide export outer membrane protein